MLLQVQATRLNDSESEINPDPDRYIDRYTLRLFYDIQNIKTTQGTDYQTFFELLKAASEEIDKEQIEIEDYVLVDVLDTFCDSFLKGLFKLLEELGFDVVIDDIE